LTSYKSTLAEWQALLGGIENVPLVVAGADEPLVEQVDEIMD